MPPILALILWFILLVGLFRFDPAKDPNASFALWIPLIWTFIIGSRLPSQWFGTGVGLAAVAFEEGNPLDRIIFLIFILLAVVILNSRSFEWHLFFTRNLVLMAFLYFALLSVIWSDFPLVAFKRWFRDLGHYLMILLVLTEPRPMEAVRSLLRRFSYLMIPLSILLFKYFPQIGMQYDAAGSAMFVGPTTGKNTLGVVCLVSGIFFFWDTLTRWSDRKERRTRRIIRVNFAFIAMSLWLLNLANSATSKVCLVIGCLVIVAVHSRWGKRHPGFLKVMIPASFLLYLILAFGLNLNGNLAEAVGRDATLTTRTAIWNTLLNMHTNPLVGTGYESFWLGPRLQRIWQMSTIGVINEAHNGYLEVYLNLGLTGLFLLVGFLITSYRNIRRRLKPPSSLVSLNLALWTIMLFYNMTEAAFKYHLMWVIFLLAAIDVPQRAEDRVRGVAAFDNATATERLHGLSLETTGWRR